MSRQHELTALKTAGVSLYRVSLPILLLMNLHIGLACVSNVLTVMNSPHAELLRFLNPLGM